MAGLFDPLTIVRNLQVKNRVVMAPMVVAVADKEGRVTKKHIEHYVARAKGGVGMIIVEANWVDPAGRGRRGDLLIHTDEHVPALSSLVQAVRPYGVKIVLQIAHPGSHVHRERYVKQPVAPSAVESSVSKMMPRELSISEIKFWIRAFADGARRAKEAGFDAVELHGAHSHLINQFLSPHYNRRTDEYGGSFENRLRFVLETVAECRKRIGDVFPLFIRISADEFLDGGLRLSDMQEVSKRLVEAGIHLVDVSAGSRDANVDRRRSGEGWMVYLAEGIKTAVGVPVIAVGAITTPEFADSVIRQNRADLVALGRGLLFDAEWANKAAEKLGAR